MTALYETKEYVWLNDHYFYPLDTLPELIAFFILCWPALLARCASPTLAFVPARMSHTSFLKQSDASSLSSIPSVRSFI